jgi:hypothetical protein
MLQWHNLGIQWPSRFAVAGMFARNDPNNRACGAAAEQDVDMLTAADIAAMGRSANKMQRRV